MLSPYARITTKFAEREVDRVCRRVIRHLQQIPSGEAGDFSPYLNTLWDEICVQVQGQESVCWELYLQVVENCLTAEIERLPRPEREAIWLTTDNGTSWAFDDERSDDDPPVSDDDIFYEIRSKLLGRAGDWSNTAIRAQQEADLRE